MKRIWPTAFLLVFLSVGAAAAKQSTSADLSVLLADVFARVEDGRPPGAIPDEMLTRNPQEVLGLLRSYERSPSARVREQAYTLGWRVGRASNDATVRREVAARLVSGCGDPEALVWQHACQHLLSFEETDFSPAAKENIQRLFHEDPPKPAVVRLVGVAGLREELPRIGALVSDKAAHDSSAQSGRWYGTVSWAARLARARLGFQEDVPHILRLVESEKDPVIRVTVLLHDLAYTRQPAAIEVVRQYLDSEESLPRVKETALGTKYAQYAIDILAEQLPDCPVLKKYVGAYTEAEVVQAREWMRNRPR
ncbi:MAG: hypothetical protein V2A79_05250 [Planctomycetota bacterium]